MKYSFFDDYSEGSAPEILEFLQENNDGFQTGYCKDDYCSQAAERIRSFFDLPNADVHFLPNGTICNVVGLASMLRSFEGIISVDGGHINTHESGAIEAAGFKILSVPAADGKLTPELIRSQFYEVNEHTVVPKVVYISQSTELGTLYSAEEIRAITACAKEYDMYTYLDGARLAIALTSSVSKCDVEEFSSLGLDMFYLGGTKNGGIYGEAIVILNPDLKYSFRNHIKQRGALMAKGRFMGLQFMRFFDTDNLWMELGKHANSQAEKLYSELKNLGIKFDQPFQSNQIFPILPNRIISELGKSVGFYRWAEIDDSNSQIRFVTSWATSDDQIDTLIKVIEDLID